MLQDQRTIEINTPPEQVYKHIETMPNKFPIYKILETRPFFFLRIALVDGIRTAVSIVFNKNFHKIMNETVMGYDTLRSANKSNL